MNEKIPLVSVSCCTFNHAPYIRQCLEGFVQQKTEFEFEVLVHDDASNDGTVEIIREFEKKYPQIIKPIYEVENQYSKHDGSISRIQRKRALGKYFVYCEGDDYWTDKYKLQKQIDFLEKHPDYGMCYGKARNFVQKSGKFKNVFGADFFTFENLINENTIPTLTVVVRKDLLECYYNEIKPEDKKWRMGDYPQWLWFSKNSKVKFFPNVFGVYRILQKSASHTNVIEETIAFEKSYYDIKLFFANHYGYNNSLVPPFDEHKVRAYFYMHLGMGKIAAKEFLQVKNRTRKIRFLSFFCSHFLLFCALYSYYRIRYGW